ncbi:hypothetical protein B0T26DRAFT_680580 [Lasiosphaeria miniovina]|uniref:F-box domain-containing protein n=1 Tax=Lasiosphaeria miniovina TaxID=1954250 RepID=A0AA40A0G3_9PEZI|nr:uncharacterized protein B0T26DRAFT_680580 [Lasiosphaeria miniovina]KAK0706990.1 hypothetical protein B0T26DRAFT_680580 [Lasiosphaeria miniovina]
MTDVAETTSQPKTKRPHGVPSIPSKILRMIFSNLQQSTPPSDPNPNRNLQRIRMVSRRFYNLSSDMLFPVIDIDISTTSLRKIDIISRHEAMRLGVRAVRIRVDLMSPILAESRLCFRHYCWGIPRPDPHISYHELPETFATEDDFLATWARYNYKALYHDQMHLLQTGEFTRVVAQAMARMDRARSLELYTTKFFTDYYEEEAEMFNDFAEMQDDYPEVGTLRRFEHEWEDRSMPLTAIYIDLPRVLHEAGVHVTKLSVDFSWGEWILELKRLSSSQAKGIQNGLKECKTLRFIISGHAAADGQNGDTQRVQAFYLMEKYLNAPSLETVEVGNNSVIDYFDISQRFLAAQCWSSVRNLYIRHGEFGLREVRLLVDSLTRPISSLTLDGTALPTNEEDQYLDILRGLAQKVRILDPLLHPGSAAERVFDSSGGLSLANRYCEGLIDKNPLRDN